MDLVRFTALSGTIIGGGGLDGQDRGAGQHLVENGGGVMPNGVGAVGPARNFDLGGRRAWCCKRIKQQRYGNDLQWQRQ